MKISMEDKLEFTKPDYNPNSYHGNPEPLKMSMDKDPLFENFEADDLDKNKKRTDKNY